MWKKFVIGASLLAMSVAASAQTPDWPNDVKIEHVKAFMAALNVRDDEKLKSSIETTYAPETLAKKPAADIARQFKELQSQLGTLKIESVTVQGEQVLVKATSESLGVLLDVKARVTKEAPHKILAFGASSGG